MLEKVFRVITVICGMLFGYGASNYLIQNWSYLAEITPSGALILVTSFVIIFGLIFYNIFRMLSKRGERMAHFIVTDLVDKVPRNEIAFGCVGLLAGLLIAYLLSPIINGLQVLQAFNLNVILQVLLYLILGTLGVILGSTMGRDVRVPNFAVVQTSREREQQSRRKKNKNAVPKILDTSVIIDGRIVDILKTGFLEGDIVIPDFVLVELRHIADSSDSLKRNRGRRGLDILNKIQTEYGIEIYETGEDKALEDIPEVDVKLLKLAQIKKGMVVTNDFNLNKVARIQGVGVLNINELANSLKPVVLPGERMGVFLVKEGKESNQAVAYLDDGTMIVVENGRKYIGQNVDVNVTSVLQTSAGRMIFAKPM